VAGRSLGVLAEEAELGILIEQVLPGRPADAAGITGGDVLVAVAGQPTPSFAQFDALARSFRAGRAVELSLLRGDQRLTVTVVPGITPPWVGTLLTMLASLAYLGVGVLALLQAPADLRARLLFFFSLAVSIELALPRPVASSGGWVTLYTLTFYLITGLEMGLELHLASVIPIRYSWFARRPWLTPAYYATGLGVGALTSAMLLAEALGWRAFPWDRLQAQTILNMVALPGWAVAVVLILTVQVRCAGDARRRQQAMLVLLGVMPWAAFMVASSALSTAGITIPAVVFGTVQILAILMYPLAVLVAIFRYSLLDIELVLRRSIVYGIVTVVMVLLLYGALNVVGIAVGGPTSGLYPLWAVSALMLLLGLLFAPLRDIAQRLVDRRLFPERLAMRQRLTELAASLPERGQLTAIGRHLVHGLSEVFGFSSATLLVADPDSGVLVTLSSSTVDVESRFGQSFLLESDDPGLQLLSRTGRPLHASQLAQHSAGLAQRLNAFEAEHALALRSGETLVGLLLLGPKADGEPLLSEEQELLGLFSHTVATVLENVHLFASATYESMTGLLRREAILATLDQELERAVRYQRPLSVGMADLDHFKRVNDTHGHLTGDALLKRVAQTLASGLRSTDALGRYGGEEFFFVLPETDLDGAAQVAEKLRRNVELLQDPVEGAEGLSVTISIGLAELTAGGITPVTGEALIAAADRKLLEAKRAGRNRVMPDPAAAA
jgi:diguanylate cyclase (GGDEF)-like protein